MGYVCDPNNMYDKNVIAVHHKYRFRKLITTGIVVSIKEALQVCELCEQNLNILSYNYLDNTLESITSLSNTTSTFNELVLAADRARNFLSELDSVVEQAQYNGRALLIKYDD